MQVAMHWASVVRRTHSKCPLCYNPHSSDSMLLGVQAYYPHLTYKHFFLGKPRDVVHTGWAEVWGDTLNQGFSASVLWLVWVTQCLHSGLEPYRAKYIPASSCWMLAVHMMPVGQPMSAWHCQTSSSEQSCFWLRTNTLNCPICSGSN